MMLHQKIKIDSKDISVIVQGAIDKEYTPHCLESIRTYLPKAEIILSTWEGSDIEGLDYDKLLLNKDPGGFAMSPFETNNVKRQVYSTLQGLKQASRQYSLKIRSDIELVNNNFTKYLNKFNNYNNDWHFFKKRIIIPSLISRDPRIWESPMCPSDWCSFGLTEDMLNLWNIDFPTNEEEEWFKYHQKDENVLYYYNCLEARFNPEQFIWFNFVKKYKKYLHSAHMFDVNKDSIEETLLSFANNLIILNEEQFGIRLLKKGRPGSDKWHVITHNEFLSIYNKYSNGHKFVLPIDIARINLFPYLKVSYQRLYKKAKDGLRVGDFLRKELKFYAPILYFLFKPLIWGLRKKENKEKHLELWWKVQENLPFFSIVIPTHGRLDLFLQTLECLKKQTFKDFEVIISDDSSSKKERNFIKDALLKFHSETNIDIKYIFSKVNLGQSKNTNQGLNHIRGKWCRILHSDDVLDSDLFEEERMLIEQNSDMIAIFHNTVTFHNEKELICLTNDSYSDFYDLHDANFLIVNSLHSHCPVPSALLFKSELMQSIGKFDPGIKRACDWDFWNRIVLFALRQELKLMHAQDKKVFYRRHNEQNRNRISTRFLNYQEYKDLAFKTAVNLHREGKTQSFIKNYLCGCYAYRKKRLLKDYKELSLFAKIILFKQFFNYLIGD